MQLRPIAYLYVSDQLTVNEMVSDFVDPNPFERPVYLMCKPAGAACNLACHYCYYLEKSKYYADAPGGNVSPRRVMSDEMLEIFIRRYIEAQPGQHVQFTWHGGETLLRPVEFYRRAISLQNKYGRDKIIENCIQTNGLLLNDEWCRFFRDNGWLVGISIDGPEEFHDEYRRGRGGEPTFRRVMKGIRLLQRNNVEWNALAVVNDYNADYPDEFYNFFKQIGCRYIQFTPVVERMTRSGLASVDEPQATITGFSVAPRQWGEFLCRLFDLWVREDVGSTFIQLFDATLANWAGYQPGVCTLARTCGHAAVMEYDGEVYSCDHFVFPAYRLGNLRDTPLAEMMMSPRQISFGAAKQDSLTDECRRCRWINICNGECPRNRFAVSSDGQPGMNYLCEGYRMFFSHVAPYMDFMCAELAAGRPPANVMTQFHHG